MHVPRTQRGHHDAETARATTAGVCSHSPFFLARQLHSGSLPARARMGVNVTLDDSDPSIIYNGIWENQGCPACNVDPSSEVLSQLWGSTFHAATVSNEDLSKEAIFLFRGTSVYLFGATLASAPLPFIRDAHMTFFIDNAYVGEFTRSAGTRDEADVPLFVQTGLGPGNHTLSVQIAPNSVALLDYLVYEMPTDSDTNGYKADSAGGITPAVNAPSGVTGNTALASGSQSAGQTDSSATPEAHAANNAANLPLIVGIIAAVLVVIIAVLLFFIFRRKRQDKHDPPHMTHSQFYIDEEREVLDIKGAPLSRYHTESPAPRTPTFQRAFFDPGTSAHFDRPSRENTPSPAQFITQLSSSPRPSPLALNPPQLAYITQSAYMPQQAFFTPQAYTPSEYPLPLGPPSEVTYRDDVEVPVVHIPPPPPIPAEPRQSSPTPGQSRRGSSRPASHAAHSVRRLVVYNAPSDISASSENGGQDGATSPTLTRTTSAPSDGRRRRAATTTSPPPPMPPLPTRTR
ncbi:hypothetical protein BKA62DRAFT_88224 [Auriculariales sp. MPI-PUGE-AT-0066]|nr:hypothetical protein BKA62DRAFT_88224 [Auriculariales sp. MPI-PUGE-AT-0066]